MRGERKWRKSRAINKVLGELKCNRRKGWLVDKSVKMLSKHWFFLTTLKGQHFLWQSNMSTYLFLFNLKS